MPYPQNLTRDWFWSEMRKCTSCCSLLTYAKWDLRRALAFVSRGYPFSLFTISEYVYDRKIHAGLNSKGILKINEDKSIAYAKPVYYAYQDMTSMLDHRMERLPALSYEVTSDSSLSVYAFQHRASQDLMVFAWIESSIPSGNNQSTPADIILKGVAFSDPVLVDLRTGVVYQFNTAPGQARGGQYQLSNIPVYDSPVAIVERPLINLK